MSQELNPRRLFAFTLIASILTLSYWLLGTNFNVYNWQFGGAIFELMWLPMLITLFAIPILCLSQLIKERFRFRSPFYLPLILHLGLFAYLYQIA